MKNYSENLVKDRVTIYDNGIKFSFINNNSYLCKYVKDNKNICDKTRSKILTFSKSSRRRMRDFLLRYYVPGMVRCGVTLTLPWQNQNFDSSLKNFEVDYLAEFSKVVHRFRVYWLRRFPACGCVYRVELQKRKVPHLHLISYHSSSDIPYLKDDYLRLWLFSVRHLYGGKLSYFSLYGVYLDTQLSSVRALQYLSDHSSKSKQAQLGYKGKQWGVWGHDNFTLLRGCVFHFDSYEQYHFFSRHVFRFRRFIIKNTPCVFGCKKSAAVSSFQSVQFLSKSTSKRLYRLSQLYEYERLFLRLSLYYIITRI